MMRGWNIRRGLCGYRRASTGLTLRCAASGRVSWLVLATWSRRTLIWVRSMRGSPIGLLPLRCRPWVLLPPKSPRLSAWASALLGRPAIWLTSLRRRRAVGPVFSSGKTAVRTAFLCRRTTVNMSPRFLSDSKIHLFFEAVHLRNLHLDLIPEPDNSPSAAADEMV